MTYRLLVRMRYGWRLRPGSFVPRRRTLHRPVCSASREQSGGRKGSRWVTACVVSEGCPGRSPPARHLCTTPPSGSAAPLLCSWGWRARLWRRSGRRDAPQSGVGSPPGADGILEGTEDKSLLVIEYEQKRENEEWPFLIILVNLQKLRNVNVVWKTVPFPKDPHTWVLNEGLIHP